jgi:hypothetical protein
MDPHANVVEATSIAHALLARLDSHDNLGDTENDAVRLAELVIALHEWRTAGGFDPYATDPNAPVANPQANALLERVKRNAKDAASHVLYEPFGLPKGYVLVREWSGGQYRFECGIAPDGSVSS